MHGGIGVVGRHLALDRRRQRHNAAPADTAGRRHHLRGRDVVQRSPPVGRSPPAHVFHPVVKGAELGRAQLKVAHLARVYPARLEGPVPVTEGLGPALGSSAPVVLPGSAVPAMEGGSTSYALRTSPTCSVVYVRSRRTSRTKAGHQLTSAPRRLRKPVRKPMWMNSQTTQAGKPERCTRPTETTARPRER